jgi:hypothetical protein
VPAAPSSRPVAKIGQWRSETSIFSSLVAGHVPAGSKPL